MDDLEEIKRKKLEELQEQQEEILNQQAEEEIQAQQQIQQLETVVKQIFTKKALERYGNLKIAHPEKAVQLLVILAQAIKSGQIKKLDDNQLKELLREMQEKKEFKILRK